ncbi:MAG: BamA/OMP85 family outer membrane protein [Spirochaetota bacterium]
MAASVAKGLFAQTTDIDFIGNDSYEAERLEEIVGRELAATRDGTGSVADLIDAAQTLEAWYQGEGFPEADVRFRMVEIVDGEMERLLTMAESFAEVDRVEFLIDEGSRLYLGDVTFRGNDAFDDRTLRAYVPRKGAGALGSGRPLYRPGDLESIASSIRRHYLLAGYLMVEVAEPATTRRDNLVDIEFRIQEGQRFVITGVEVKGVGELPDDVAAEVEGLLPDSNQPYAERIAADGADRIDRYLGGNGYLTNVRYRIELKEESASVTIHYEFSPGQRAVLGEIRVRPEDDSELRIRPAIVGNRFSIEPGEPIDRAEIEAGRQKLYQTGLFRIVSARLEEAEAGDADEDRTVDLVITVEEDRNRYLDLAAGWGTLERLTGSAHYVDRNVFGTGRLWGVEAAGSFIGYRFSTRIVDRFLLGIGSRLELRAEHSLRTREAFSARSTSADLIADVRVTDDIRTAADYEFSWALVEDLTSADEAPEIVRLSKLNTFATYDTVDSALFPQEGTQARLGVGVAGVLVGADLSFVRLELELTRHTRIIDEIVLSVQGKGSSILPLADAEVPISERLYAGGGDSVRSFPQDTLSPVNEDGLAVGGLTRAEATVELRFEPVSNLFLALFYDVGSVASEELAITQPGHALGAGVRYRTPIGPLRLDFAVNPGPLFAAEKNWAIHFSVGSGF